MGVTLFTTDYRPSSNFFHRVLKSRSSFHRNTYCTALHSGRELSQTEAINSYTVNGRNRIHRSKLESETKYESDSMLESRYAVAVQRKLLRTKRSLLAWRNREEYALEWASGASYETDRLAFSRPVFLRPRDTIP